jgi:hypothetical protein
MPTSEAECAPGLSSISMRLRSVQALRDTAWHALGVKLLARLNMAQRVIIVIAFGVALALFGYWVALHDVYAFGWVSYTPMPTRIAKPRGLTFGEIILVWLGLTIAWAVVSIIVLHRPKPGHTASLETSSDDLSLL